MKYVIFINPVRNNLFAVESGVAKCFDNLGYKRFKEDVYLDECEIWISKGR